MMCSDREFASALGIYELFIHVSYIRHPPEFVAKLFKGGCPAYLEHMEFLPIEACADVGRDPRNYDVDIFHPGRVATSTDILVCMADRRVRPFMDQELISFLFCYGYIQLAFEFVALGSVTMIGRDPFVISAFTYDANEPCLQLVPASGPFSAHCRFPVVPLDR